MSKTDLLSVEALHAGYSANEIIHGIDFHAAHGEVVTILGPNGCGKSTFIRSLLGYVRVSSGAILFEGNDLGILTATARIRCGLGYVPQIANVFRSLSVRENLEMGGYLLSRSEAAHTIERMFELFPILGTRRAQKAGTLSGGERQLLAIARAMMMSPRLLFLDEPSAGLSPARADEVFGHVRDIALRGIAVVVVEQDAKRALAIASRGYVLVTGRVDFHGTPEEILSDERIRVAYLGGRPRHD